MFLFLLPSPCPPYPGPWSPLDLLSLQAIYCLSSHRGTRSHGILFLRLAYFLKHKDLQLRPCGFWRWPRREAVDSLAAEDVAFSKLALEGITVGRPRKRRWGRSPKPTSVHRGEEGGQWCDGSTTVSSSVTTGCACQAQQLLPWWQRAGCEK